MMSRDLPTHPDLEHLKKQAKDLLRDFRQGDPATVERFRSVASLPATARPKLAHAQHLIARQYGFASWPKLKAHVESLARASDPVEALGTAVKANDTAGVAKLFKRHPGLKSKLNDPLPGFAFGATPLLAALPWGNREMIDILLRAGADINQRSHWWAGGFGVLDDDRGLAPFLIERGAIVDVHAAARLGMLGKLEELVSTNPGLVHARGGDGQTPLHLAPTVAIEQDLLDHGAGIDARATAPEAPAAPYRVRL